MESQWSNFKLRVNVMAVPEIAYSAWTSAASLESWFLRRAVFRHPDGRDTGRNEPVQAGYTYDWYWHGYPDSVVERGKILSTNGLNRMTFTFSMGCPVTISVHEEAGETIVELVESELPTDTETMLRHYVGDSRGWIFYLTNLKSVLEGGMDLRNKKLELTNVITS